MKQQGRPTKYKPEFDEQARKLCELGAADEELANFFKVSRVTIWRWAQTHEGFCSALKVGKESADERVANSLYHKAIGYTFDSEKVFQYGGKIIRAAVKEHVPPDTTAMIFWLKNRRPHEWRDQRDLRVQYDNKDSIPDDELERIAAGGSPRASAQTQH